MGLLKTVVEAERNKMCSRCGVREGMGAGSFTIYKGTMICKTCNDEVLKSFGIEPKDGLRDSDDEWEEQNRKGLEKWERNLNKEVKTSE